MMGQLMTGKCIGIGLSGQASDNNKVTTDRAFKILMSFL